MAITVTHDEADKKREYERVLQRRRRLDATELENPDPSKRYRFINKKERTYRRAESLGFAKTDPNGATQAKHGEIKDGAIQVGQDIVLMEEPVELYEMKRREDEEALRQQVAGINEEAKQKLNRMARDELRTPAHKDIVEDVSMQGQTVTLRKP